MAETTNLRQMPGTVTIILREVNIGLGFKFNSPADEHEISKCENQLGLILPTSYREFLKLSNGAHLFCSSQPKYGKNASWWTDDGILIQDTGSIIEFNQYHDEIYVDDDGKKKFISFAYLGHILTGDFCGFDITGCMNSEYKILDCQHDCSFEDWQQEHVISSSFEEWLMNIFDAVVLNQIRPEYWIPWPLHDEKAE